MKINDIIQNVPLINNSKDTAGTNRALDQNQMDQSLADSQKSGAEVDFSKKSLEYSKALEMMEKEPVDRIEKVEALRTKIEDGTYRVDSKKVADKMIENMLTTIME